MDVSRDGDQMTQMNGALKPLLAGDMIMRDAGGVSCSIIYGQDDRSPIAAETTHVLYVAYAPTGVPVEPVEALYHRWRAVQTELEELDRTSQEKLRLTDLWSFQAKEIEAVNPQPGEDAGVQRRDDNRAPPARSSLAAHPTRADAGPQRPGRPQHGSQSFH